MKEFITLLNDVVEGLVSRGYRARGGSDVYRLLENDNLVVKVFLNNYKNPSHIVTKISYNKE